MSSPSDLVLRGRVAALVKLKYSASMIAKEVGISPRTAGRWKRACLRDETSFLAGRQYDTDGHSPYSPREKKTALEAFKHLQPLGSRSAAPKVREKPGAPQMVSRSLRRWARQAKWHPYVQPRRPDLSKSHKHQRNTFAINNKETDFSLWNFNDQFKIAWPLKGTKRKPFWAERREQVKAKPGKKFPRLLHVHASLTIHGPVPLITVDGSSMNSVKFQRVNEQLLPELTRIYQGFEFRYAHDQAAWFTSGSTQTWFQTETPASMHVVSPTEFPPNSPDINLAETAMAIALGRVFDRKPRSFDEMEAAVKAEWLALTREEIEKMYADLPGILAQIRRKKGGNTNR